MNKIEWIKVCTALLAHCSLPLWVSLNFLAPLHPLVYRRLPLPRPHGYLIRAFITNNMCWKSLVSVQLVPGLCCDNTQLEEAREYSYDKASIVLLPVESDLPHALVLHPVHFPVGPGLHCFQSPWTTPCWPPHGWPASAKDGYSMMLLYQGLV